MLSNLDDYPVHQTPDPIAHPATSDRNAYDRYWFNGYASDGELYFGIGLALYPNLGIMDCALSVVVDGEQHAFHASRRAPLEPTELEVGPFRIDILEPMRRLRVTLDENETGISGALEWIPRTANIQENRQTTKRERARMVMDATRFDQFGTWRGQLVVAGRRIDIDPARIHGTKDRSWGIRPVGSPDTGIAPPQQAPQFFFLWAPLHWPSHCSLASAFENAHGERWHWDGRIVPAYPSPDAIPGVEDPNERPLAGFEHRIDWAPGTRRARSAVLSLQERGGGRREITLEPLLCFRMKGIGYAHREWGHGRWKGELAIGGESWKCDDLNELAPENLHVQQVVRARCGSEEGIGVLEQICIGPYEPAGFQGLLDGA